MKIEYKQAGIVQELKKRIGNGTYAGMLPHSKDLAGEFDVNIKTMEKVIRKLALEGLVLRKQGHGTYIQSEPAKLENLLIELLFVGSSQMSAHPYYGEMWKGVMDGLKDTRYKLVLSVMDENKENGGLEKPYRNFTPSAAKILIGTNSSKQIELLKKQRTPFILIGSKPMDPDVPAIYADFSKSIRKVVRHLFKKGLTELAYIGSVESKEGENLLDLDKFYAFISAVRPRGAIDGSLIVHAPPFPSFGYDAMKTILGRKKPHAVYVAYDHLCPGVYQAIAEHGLRIPDDICVIGTDGLELNLSPPLFSVQVPRYEIGRKGIKMLLEMMKNPGSGKFKSSAIETTVGNFSGSIK